MIGQSPSESGGKANGEPRNGTSSPPAITLPKGGGAIRGIGEKFAANPVTGTGSMTVPIATSPGRSGFGPQLSLSYDSGSGNGPFGLGWSLGLPQITRKTDKGLPRYDDASESDVFILSGAEDLVPVLIKVGDNWVRESDVEPGKTPRTVNDVKYRVQRYRPRIEGLFARIERWTNTTDSTDVFWRSISKDNITTWYGRTAESRIADPTDATRIFSWLICQSYDDKGNVIIYDYKLEDSAKVDVAQVHERNRKADLQSVNSRSVNRHIKHIRYGNHQPYLPVLALDAPWPVLPAADQWYFGVVFDYGENDTDAPSPLEAGVWPVRNDPFSSYRAGFEVRTYRLCQRVLMFHHIPDTPNGVQGYEGLVRSTDFNYSYETNPADTRNPIFSQIVAVSQCGYKLQAGGSYLKKSFPPLEFTYSKATINEGIRNVDPQSLENLPYGFDGSQYQWVDLDGEGLSGVLTEQAEGWFYKRNLSPINIVPDNGSQHVEASFAPVELVASKPALSLAAGHAQFLDLAGDGQPDLVALRGPTPGFYERTEDEGWEPFTPFGSLPVLDWDDPNLKFVDLTGDGHADVLIGEDDVFRWHPSLAEDAHHEELSSSAQRSASSDRIVISS